MILKENKEFCSSLATLEMGSGLEPIDLNSSEAEKILELFKICMPKPPRG
jgi:hypothetical protein